jgi:hypothetical protein
MARKPHETVQLKLRFPESLRRRLERDAGRNKQSMNSEIVSRLQSSFEPRPLDLYSMLKTAYEGAVAKHGGRGFNAEAIRAVAEPLVAALMQVLPDLDYVRIALLPDEDGKYSGTLYVDQFSPKGWERNEVMHEVVYGDKS